MAPYTHVFVLEKIGYFFIFIFHYSSFEKYKFTMALVFLEEDPWLLEYESCEKLQRDIMEQLTLRQKYPRTSESYSQISANVRLRLKQYNNEVGQLERKLNDTTLSQNLYPYSY
ncbi:unnamed protein product [Acanthoscelides obtectus]|uniref:Uncharacterized protein n=1 Tax=Acanthoscelides obtectus TaxID=200917 RepID=A0A9P0LFU7_ACAOB|nr:unnamed protein product [Acanthoscelides obtectus]CAK1658968.1 hypothetical protein AOBTE_LOCUS21213 [Acanthoscelides obtectus]